MAASGTLIAVVLASGFEDSEYAIPVDRLNEAGFRLDIIGAEAGQDLVGDKNQVKVTTTKGIGQVRPEDYALLLIPGGHSPDKLRADARFVRFVAAFEQQGKPIAAVCHGPQLLEAAHLVKGRTLTAWPTVQDDLRQMGAIVKDEPLVVDRNWITSRKPSDLHLFSDAIVQRLSGAGTAKAQSSSAR